MVRGNSLFNSFPFRNFDQFPLVSRLDRISFATANPKYFLLILVIVGRFLLLVLFLFPSSYRQIKKLGRRQSFKAEKDNQSSPMSTWLFPAECKGKQKLWSV